MSNTRLEAGVQGDGEAQGYDMEAGMGYTVMAYIVMAWRYDMEAGMGYIVMAYIVMASGCNMAAENAFRVSQGHEIREARVHRRSALNQL